MTQVVKRNGSVVDFDIHRISDAIERAVASIDAVMSQSPEEIAKKLSEKLLQYDQITVDEIQVLVENELMSVNKEVARKYITYRYERDKSRIAHQAFTRDINNLVSLKDKSIINENANKDAKVFPVQRDLMAGIVSKHFAKNGYLPEHIIEAHESGDIHFHDLDYSPFLPFTNCCLVDLKGMLSNGFRLGNAEIESPRSFGVACAVTAQIVAQVASHQYGGTTIANIDQVLEEYVASSWTKHWNRGMEWEVPDVQSYADSMTQKEIYDGCQAMEYEINTLFTTNGQQPFVTFSFGMGTSKYSRWIQEAILKVRIKGLGKEGITPVFPKLVMFLEEGLNLKEGDPNYDIKKLALECSSKRLYPDIISARINRQITGSPVPVSPMGCRSFLGGWRDAEGSYTLDGRNNLGVVSVNLPRIAIESGGSFEKFWNILDSRLELVKDALEVRIDRLRGVKASVAPILYTEGAFGVKLDPEDEIINLFKFGRSSISLGYIGLHEVMKVMFPTVDPIFNEEAQDFSLAVISYMRERVNLWKEKSPEGWGYSLYSTPSESLCDRFCRLDVKKFGEIKGVNDRGWYTNSFHLDVNSKVSPFEKIDFEAPYHYVASGGHISYVEFPDMKHNIEALETVWDYAMNNLAYFGTNLPSDKCFECGFDGEFSATSKGFECPSCGNHDSSKMNTIRRVCGYLGAPSARGFNEGKQAEVVNRVKHFS
ncbi:putative anaerobic ribonucleotide reductase subunit [Aeromonas phage LAh_9]|uniref:Anaerobic ribonucleotide reductase subunit or ribonucleoside triphosphate reductase n=4 Tax=Lahexavirus TaxID=2843411 RepID=A0A5B9N848_9CAUD|nr:anaerobic ribonucleoside reductase large subunit [Aeromonas phage 4_4572]YP_009847261.1 anaerobic ribonucleoside reductase large subunit [Aeromonas phage LAh_6]YP_009847469.1 anaerobic ribonucleoside reductase large subunit [Aeromonas phage LAh_8]YP_009847563.1 anaerobic ribonucleoside reductase large subunit [Aeromonas phage LAh_9]QDH46481.1 putative anaerobic ribonucleotide reductase subunit or ribonucleoside triphosphate reductase [Aeromonas phage LAh_6]QDH46719.1 putative anaerobic ribo